MAVGVSTKLKVRASVAVRFGSRSIAVGHRFSGSLHHSDTRLPADVGAGSETLCHERTDDAEHRARSEPRARCARLTGRS